MQSSAVISGLYAAASGREEWPVAMDRVAQALDLWVVQVLGLHKGNGQLMFSSHGGQAAAQTSLDYFRYYSSIDPRIPLLLGTPADQWMHCHEHLDETYVAQSEFYQDFLIPHGGRYVTATKLIDDAEIQFVLALMRGPGSRPVGREDLAELQDYKHHFTEAFKNLVHLRETYAELGMARELLAQLGHPMLLVDDLGCIWHRNPLAQELLARGDPVLDQQGYLSCTTRVGRDRLAGALHELQLEAAAGPAARPRRRTVELPTANGRRFLAFVSALRPETAMGAFGRAARALVILHEVDGHSGAPELSPLLLGECFDLTPAEARVAVQVAAGLSLKEIAQRSHAALPTVRTQLSNVLHKTGAARQADLVRVVLSLPVRG